MSFCIQKNHPFEVLWQNKATEKLEHIIGLNVKSCAMFIDKYKSFLKWPYSTRELTIEEDIKNNITDLFNDGSWKPYKIKNIASLL
jgi:hypothetical protein